MLWTVLGILTRREVLIPLAAACAGFWIWHNGYDRGHERATAAAEARVDALQADLRENSRRLSAALSALETERAAHAAEIERIEDDARNADGAGRLALPADSVQRLRSRWRAD